MNSSLFIHSTTDNAVVIQILVERLATPETCYALRDELRTFIANQEAERVIFDFSKVEFMGSVAFLAFLALRREKLVDQIQMCGVSDSIQGMLRACKLIPGEQGNATPFDIVEPV